MLNQRIQSAKKATDKLNKAKNSRKQRSQEREKSLQEKIQKVSLGAQRSQTQTQLISEKAKNHIDHVKSIADLMKEKIAQDVTTKSQEINSKVQKGVAKREQKIEEIKQKAKASTQMTKNWKKNDIYLSNISGEKLPIYFSYLWCSHT